MELVRRADTAAFIQCHVNAFEYLGGVPRRCLCDNAKKVIWEMPRPPSASSGVVRRCGSICACPELAEEDARTVAADGEPPFSRGQALPGYSPDCNADEAVWGWVREETTGNLCLGSKAVVQERVGNFLAGLAIRQDEVRRRCGTVL